MRMVLTVKVMSKGRRASSQVLPPFQYMCRKKESSLKRRLRKCQVKKMQVPAIFLRSVSRLKDDRKLIKIVLKRT